jgi:hypothetical protein
LRQDAEPVGTIPIVDGYVSQDDEKSIDWQNATPDWSKLFVGIALPAICGMIVISGILYLGLSFVRILLR